MLSRTSPSKRLNLALHRHTQETPLRYTPKTPLQDTQAPLRSIPVEPQYTASLTMDQKTRLRSRFERLNALATLAYQVDCNTSSVHAALLPKDQSYKIQRLARDLHWRRRLPCSKTLGCGQDCHLSTLLSQPGLWSVVPHTHRKIAMIRKLSPDEERTLQLILPKTSKP